LKGLVRCPPFSMPSDPTPLTVLRAATISLGVFIPGSEAAIQFDLSPPRTTAGVGLSPLNEFLAGCDTCGGDGSGNEVGAGILFDPGTALLTFEIGYGSAAGFSDLTGAAFAWYLHGPAGPGEAGEILRDLEPFHEFGASGASGGFLHGAIQLDPVEVDHLMRGLTYVNIYTEAFPGGELRGQLYRAAVPESNSWPGSLMGVGMAVMAAMARRRRTHLRRQDDPR